ncbi:TatD family hydrolase [Candidatus Parcubacteria bacterium]|nr:TatD family hydrolase [Candidatus Parcubacteria bacterium]
MRYIDIHSHLNFPGKYEDDWEEVIERLRETETSTIVVGTDLLTSKKAVEIAEKYENIYACIGVHPVDDPNKTFNEKEFEDILGPKVVAVGECGLDFFHVDKEKDFNRQKKLFLDQIYFALNHDRPLMIHSRDAYLDLLEILEPLKVEHGDKLRGDIHFYAGDLETAKRFWNIGFTTSFTGVITFTRDYDEIIKNAPIEMIQAETDAPFVSPLPYRGKRNEPSYVVEVVKKIAEIRGEDLEMVEKALISNAKRLFSLV